MEKTFAGGCKIVKFVKVSPLKVSCYMVLVIVCCRVILVICLYITVDVARAILILFLFNVFFFVSMYLLSKVRLI